MRRQESFPPQQEYVVVGFYERLLKSKRLVGHAEGVAHWSMMRRYSCNVRCECFCLVNSGWLARLSELGQVDFVK